LSFWEAFVLLLVYVPLMLIWGTSIIDIFRRDDIGGVSKALWLLTVVVLPLLGTLLYLIVWPVGVTSREREGIGLAGHDVVARHSPHIPTQRLAVLDDLHERGKLTDEEFGAERARLLATSTS
jgi:hypothetical protein